VHFKATRSLRRPRLPGGPPGWPACPGPSLKGGGGEDRAGCRRTALEAPTYARQLELASLGVKVLDYVPDNALLVRPAPGVSLDRIRLVPGVRAVFELAPGLKLSPELAGLVGKAGPEASSLPAESWVEAALFTGADPDALGKAALEALPGVKIAWTKRSSGHPIRGFSEPRKPPSCARDAPGRRIRRTGARARARQ
jgi:hypothetical protein